MIGLPPPCFMVSYERNQFFKGRDEFLKQIFDRFRDTTPRPYQGRIALFGLGGIGKTQTALEYVYRYQSSYNRIYWIAADNQASLLNGYQKIAKRSELQISLNSNPIEIAEHVLSWLRQEEKWLLVIDNLDDINVLSTSNLGHTNVVATLVPQTGPQQHTLITTRNPNSGGIPADGLEVPVLDPTNAIDLLSTLSKIAIAASSSESKQAYQIIQALGYLPLAIEQAAAYVREVAGDFVTFLDDYNKNHKDVHKWIPQGIRSYPHSVATTWSMSFNIVRNNNSQAAELLQLLSFLNPDGILIEFLQSGVEALPDGLRQIVSNRIDMSKALIELERFSLLKWNRLTKTLLIHRLIQMVIRDEMSDADLMTLRTIIIDLCDQSFPQEWINENRKLCREYIGQIMGPLLDLEIIRTEKSASIMFRVGWFLREDGKISDSERLSSQAVKIYREILGDDHCDTLTTMHNLASTYRAQGRTGEAAGLQEEVLEKSRRILGDDHPDTLTTMDSLAKTYSYQGKTGEAAGLQEEVLEKERRILGDDHPDTLTTMNNLANTYWAQGRTGEAAALHEQVLEKRRRILGDEHPSTLTTMHNLATTYWARGRTGEAAALEEQVLEKRRRILGDDHPATLTTMNNLATTYRDLGRTAEAAALEEQVLEKRRRILGDDHPDTLASMNNLATTYRAQGRTGEVAALEEEVLEKRRRITGNTNENR